MGAIDLVDQGRILASLIWLAILLGPALVLTFLAASIYVDSGTRGVNLRPVRVDNRIFLLLLVVSFTGWLLMLKFIYLPAIGFGTQFLTVDGATRYNYTDLYTLQVLGTMALDWVRNQPWQAGLMLGCLPIICVAVLLMARALGRSAAMPLPPKTVWQ